ncbi:MAG: right-handed parallel beta-helix repeat-containing protein [Ktedonobacterales bacterium]|nr:right-handed parallel beta-helix repeat-containing protein [Ktedonobacterales bacterium]
MSGTGALNQPFHNVQFKGLTFANATWLEPASGDGFPEVQANEYAVGSPISGALIADNVSLRIAKSLRFERCLFTHLGGAGLGFDTDTQNAPVAGSQNNVILGNTFTDISGSGLQMGELWLANPTDARQQNTGNNIQDNYITNVVAEYFGAVGIMIRYTQNTTITHNEVTNLPYSGIAYGLIGNPS